MEANMRMIQGIQVPPKEITLLQRIIAANGRLQGAGSRLMTLVNRCGVSGQESCSAASQPDGECLVGQIGALERQIGLIEEQVQKLERVA